MVVKRPGSSPDLVKKSGIVLDEVGLHWRSSVDKNHGLKSNLPFISVSYCTPSALVTLLLSSSFTFDPFSLHWKPSANHMTLSRLIRALAMKAPVSRFISCRMFWKATSIRCIVWWKKQLPYPQIQHHRVGLGAECHMQTTSL